MLKAGRTSIPTGFCNKINAELYRFAARPSIPWCEEWSDFIAGAPSVCLPALYLFLAQIYILFVLGLIIDTLLTKAGRHF